MITDQDFDALEEFMILSAADPSLPEGAKAVTGYKRDVILMALNAIRSKDKEKFVNLIEAFMYGIALIDSMTLKDGTHDRLVSRFAEVLRDSRNKLTGKVRGRKTPAERAKLRPSNYASLSPMEQWKVDRALGILDWNGDENDTSSLQ